MKNSTPIEVNSIIGNFQNYESLSLQMNKRIFKDFIKVFFIIPWYQPYNIYHLYLLEYSELHPLKNPFFEEHVSYLQYWVAYKDQKPIGRIGAWIDTEYNKIQKYPDKKTGWIGLFECIEDSSVARMLIETACKELRKKGIEKILGPGRFNASSQVGLQIDGFDINPYFMEPFNPPYYEDYFSIYGKKETDWYSFGINSTSFKTHLTRVEKIEAKHGKFEDKLKEKGIRVYSPKKSTYNVEIDRVIHLYNKLWQKDNHPQFSPLLKKERLSLKKSIQLFCDKSLILIAETNDRDVIGIAVAVPNINEALYRLPFVKWNVPFSVKLVLRDIIGFSSILKKVVFKSFSQIRILILGSSLPMVGLDTTLYKNLFVNASLLNIKQASASQIAEPNLLMMGPLKKMGSVEKKWRVYSF
ncbi:MAG: GNAT family N-acetyltransferase [Caldisericia bacterium]|nr:GNAT family N-acetyltransferase [Caldisericia bacterium]